MFSLPKILRTKLSPCRLALTLLFLFVFLTAETAIAQQAEVVLKRCWLYPSENISNLTVASDNVSKQSAQNDIVVSQNTEKIISVNAKGGEKNWETNLGGEISSNILAVESAQPDEPNIYVVINRVTLSQEKQGKKESVLSAIDRRTGLPRWKIDLEFAEKSYLARLPNRIIIAGENGNIYSINKASGEILWRKTLQKPVAALLTLKDERIVLALGDGQVVVLSAEGGETTNQFGFTARVSAITEDVAAGNLIVGDIKGNFAAVNQKTGRRVWRARLGAAVSDISSNGKGFLVASLDNFIYFISAPNGRLIWKRRLSGRIVSPPLVGKDFLVAASIDESSASIISMDDGKLLNRIYLENGNSFTGQAVSIGNFLIFLTRSGIAGYTNEQENCRTK